MKKNNFRKFISAAAVLSVSATAALSAISFAACNTDVAETEQPEKLITADVNHSPDIISTAEGTVQTRNSGTKYFCTPTGSNMNDGLSWSSATSLESLLLDQTKLQPGDTVYVQPGTYNMVAAITVQSTISGTYDNFIRIVNAGLESESGYEGTDKVVTLDCSGQTFDSTARGIQIYGDYIYWYGIDICGAGDNGMYIGGSYNTVEYCEFYNNRDTGLQLGRAASGLNTVDEWPSYNLIKNCTSHNNYDNETYGENADGFAAKLTVGYGNVFDGCIAYRNSDDGWDLYAKTDSGNIGCVIIYNCVAFENGYIEYTQAENNARFPLFNKNYTETFKEGDDVRYFRTRDGDGNGFKLGGSAMEGDVVMYNCLSFNNRMHGVTDNSNPGYLKVEGVTSYDNSAAICDDPNSDEFGQIIAGANHDTHGNINVARQTYSYNSVINVLSVKSGYAVSLETDDYRGSVTNSLLVGADATNVIKNSMDADTKIGLDNEQKIASIDPNAVFTALPFTYSNGEYARNISGLNDLYASGTSGALNPARVHITYRNPDDGSINMGNILAKKSSAGSYGGIAISSVGSTLNNSSWGAYKHFFSDDTVVGGGASEDLAQLKWAEETLTINTDENAVYQDFEVPIKMNDCTIDWSVSGENAALVEIGTDIENSISNSKYITILVNRPTKTEGDKKVTLTATITVGEESTTKDFVLNIKAGDPTIGKITVLTRNGVTITDGASYVVDMYSVFTEPEIQVQNGLDYNGKLLKKGEQYTCTTEYWYASSKSAPFIQVKDFTPSNDGVFQITHTVKLVSDATKTKTMTYTLYVSSTTAQVDFMEEASVSVNRDGFLISGQLDNATGYLYAVSVASGAAPTVENIKNFEGVERVEFRSDNISLQFKNFNNASYKVYYALANLKGEITSRIYDASITTTNIDSESAFNTLAATGKIGSENAATTIYVLTKDLDFSGKSWTTGTKEFTGLLNGNGHTVKNVTVNISGKGAGIFYKVTGGTIENIKFENISITGGDQQAGLVATCYGGYFYNIAIHNIKVQSTTRTGGLIGHAFDNPKGLGTYIEQVSIVNDNSDDYYIKSASGTAWGQRSGGIIGLIQGSSSANTNIEVFIKDCYVIADITGSEQVGGIVGSFDNQNSAIGYTLEINRCYFGGQANSSYTTPRVGGILGYQPGNIGTLTIVNCISVGKLYNLNTGNIDFALKTASLIVGGFASTAVNTVKNCIAAMEEYNTDYEVNVYTAENMQINIAGIEETLGDDFEERWSFVYQDGSSNRLQAPYLTLDFLNN